MSDTSSPTEKATSVGWAEVVERGRQLTRQLGDGRDDLALTWMAHHVARLMTEAEAAEGEEADRLQELCRRAILDLWKARRAIFDRVPLQSVEEVGEAVRALKEGNGWFFNRMAYDDERPLGRAMELAYAVDGGARAIIRALVGDAVRRGLADEKDWIWLVRSGLPDIDPVIVLLQEAIVTSQPCDEQVGDGNADNEESEQTDANKPADPLRSERIELIERLRTFAEIAGQIADHLTAARTATKGKARRSKK